MWTFCHSHCYCYILHLELILPSYTCGWVVHCYPLRHHVAMLWVLILIAGVPTEFQYGKVAIFMALSLPIEWSLLSVYGVLMKPWTTFIGGHKFCLPTHSLKQKFCAYSRESEHLPNTGISDKLASS